MSTDEMYTESPEAGPSMTDSDTSNAPEVEAPGVIDTGGVDDYVEPEIVDPGTYKLKLLAFEKKRVKWEKNGGGTATVYDARMMIIESKYKNPYAVKYSIFINDAATEQELNTAKGKIIRLRQWAGDPDPKSRKFDSNTLIGSEGYCNIGSKARKDDATLREHVVKSFML